MNTTSPTKRIVILGSKPNASFVDADEVWCANAAIGFYGDEVRRYPTAVNVASAVILRKNLRDADSLGGLYARKWAAVAAARPSKLVLFAAPGDAGCDAEVQGALRAGGYASPIEVCSVRQRIELVGEVAGLRYPVMTGAFFRQPLAVQLRDAVLLARFLRASWDAGSDDDAPGKFRPSTGVLALLLAIQRHGAGAEYVVAGIGVEERWAQQADGTVLVGKMATRHGGLTPHVHADVAILRALSRRHAVLTTEPELARLVPFVFGRVSPGRTAVAPGNAAA